MMRLIVIRRDCIDLEAFILNGKRFILANKERRSLSSASMRENAFFAATVSCNGRIGAIGCV